MRPEHQGATPRSDGRRQALGDSIRRELSRHRRRSADLAIRRRSVGDQHGSQRSHLLGQRRAGDFRYATIVHCALRQELTDRATAVLDRTRVAARTRRQAAVLAGIACAPAVFRVGGPVCVRSA